MVLDCLLCLFDGYVEVGRTQFLRCGIAVYQQRNRLQIVVPVALDLRKTSCHVCHFPVVVCVVFCRERVVHACLLGVVLAAGAVAQGEQQGCCEYICECFSQVCSIVIPSKV